MSGIYLLLTCVGSLIILFLEQTLGSYKMESNPRGYCVIINNCTFEKMPQRRGTKKDAGNDWDLYHSSAFVDLLGDGSQSPLTLSVSPQTDCGRFSPG